MENAILMTFVAVHAVVYCMCQNGKQQPVNVLLSLPNDKLFLLFGQPSCIIWQLWHNTKIYIQIKLTVLKQNSSVSFTNLDWNLKCIIKCCSMVCVSAAKCGIV